MSELVHVNGWDLIIDGEEPRVRDVDIAEAAGLSRPRDIRQTIEANRKELEAHGPICVRGRRARINNIPGLREVSENYLNEAQSIAVIAFLRTKQAMQLRIELVKTFVAYRHGQAPAKALPVGLDIATSPRLGEYGPYKAQLIFKCGVAARTTGRSIHAVHGVLRKQYHVPSVYQIPYFAWPHVAALLDQLIAGELAITCFKPARLIKDPRQMDLFN